MFAESEDEEQIIERVARWISARPRSCVVCGCRARGRVGCRRGQYSTMVGSLSELANRLVELGIERVVMEATSDYWRPPFSLFEAHGLRPWLVNARDVKHLPGRPKTDVLDACGCARSPNDRCCGPASCPRPTSAACGT